MQSGDRRLSFILAIAFVAISVTLQTSLAEEKADPGKGKKSSRGEFVERFDADGDGKLSLKERTQAREQMKRRDHGRRRGRGESREALVERFDADGDGKLSLKERTQAREQMKRRVRRDHGRRHAEMEKRARDHGRRHVEMEKRARRDPGRRHAEMERRRSEFMRGGFPDRMIERFDKDGDGTLSEEERRGAAKGRRNRATKGARKE